MVEVFHNFISNITVLKVGAWLGEIVTILLLIMFARKRNRDERGWKILGKASIVSFVWLIVFVNFIAQMIGQIGFSFDLGFIQCGNIIQWIYDTTIMVEIIAIFIIRKFE